MEGMAFSPPRSQRTLYLHIGIPKTASTWLQKKVFPLLEHLYYVDCPKSLLFNDTSDLVDQRLMASVFKRSSQVWSDFGDAIFQDLLGDREAWLDDGRDLLISEEGIGRQASRPALFGAHLNEMQQKAREWGFSRLSILCMIRRQDHWLASHYAQMSDRNPVAGQTDFERLVREITSPRLARYGFGMLLDFSVIHEHVKHVVGSKDLTMLPYELLEKYPQTFLQTLLERLDTPPHKTEEIIRLTPGTIANVRSEGEAWRLRPPPSRKMAGFTLPRWRLGKREQTIEITRDIADSIRRSYSSGNQRLATRTGIELEEYGYFDFNPKNG